MGEEVAKRSEAARRKIVRRRQRRIRRVIVILLAVLAVLAVFSLGRYLGSEKEALELQLTGSIDGVAYPESLVELYERNEEARDFVLGYGDYKGNPEDISVKKEVKKGEIPLFLQWDKRWGYELYGNDFIAVTGCGPTCLAMVYCGLTGDTSQNPYTVARRAVEEGYYVEGSGTSWSMMEELAEEMGLTVDAVPFDEEHILQELQDNHPIICVVGPGDFTSNGHYIVLCGMDRDGLIEIRDPNSPQNTKEKWELGTIMKQTRNLWGYGVSGD